MIDTILNYLLKHKLFDVNVYESIVLDADYIVVAAACSEKQVNDLAFKLLKYVKIKYNIIGVVAGYNTSWIIIDFNNILVHLALESVIKDYFLDELYNLKV